MAKASEGGGKGGRGRAEKPTLKVFEGPGGQLPPQNVEAEQGVLGSILLENAAYDDVVAAGLVADDFYRDSHQILFAHIADLREAGQPADALTLHDSLVKSGQLKEIGGIEYIGDVVNAVPHAANAAFYAEIVRQKAVARRVIEAANEMLRSAYSGMYEADELLEISEANLTAASSSATKDSTQHAVVPVTEFITRLYDPEARPPGLHTGLTELDTITGGFQPEHLVIVAGRPSMGKSALAQTIAAWVGAPRDDRPVVTTLMFSVEMSRSEIAGRLVNICGQIPEYMTKTPDRWMDAGRRAMVDRAYEQIRCGSIFVNDQADLSAGRLSRIAHRQHRRTPLGLIVVDYLQLLAPDNDRDPRQEQIAKMSRKLKHLAREIGCPVIALSQLNREVENREDKRPRMADLRESGAIEQDADVVVLVHRPEYYKPDDKPGMAELIVAKNRNGRTGTAEVGWSGSTFTFADLVPAL